MKKSLTLLSVGDLKRGSEELVSNAAALHPDLPATALVPHIIELAEPDFLAELDQSLRAAHFLRLIRVRRVAELRERRQAEWLFPEIQRAALTLPLRVPIGEGKTIPRNALHFADMTRYLKMLDKRDKAHHDSSPQRDAIKVIRKLWPRSQRASKTITLGEVDVLRAKKAGGKKGETA
jgi:hypothetical protein